jgi:hypothetical protein
MDALCTTPTVSHTHDGSQECVAGDQTVLCYGINTPEFPVKSSLSGLDSTQRAQRERFQVVDADALESMIDPDTAQLFPVKCASFVGCNVDLVVSSGAGVSLLLSTDM